MKKDQPLVSVAVICYNSSETVVETLNSIAAQTYSNLELVISDDGSPDNTVDICEAWIHEHKNRFLRTEILTVDKNMGVTSNYARATKACKAKWVKEIDGDDLLLPDCIETYINYVTEHPETIYLFGKVDVFGIDKNKIQAFEKTIFDYSFFQLSMNKQYEWLIARSFQPIPSVVSFYNKESIDKLGIIYDERIPMLEDWPRWIQCLQKGVKLHFIDKVVARYRVCENSICSGNKHTAAFMKSIALNYLIYQFKPSIKYIGYRVAIDKYLKCKTVATDSKIWKILYKIYHPVCTNFEWIKAKIYKCKKYRKN